ncbi:predicted protein [Naegleria gruberi]|uniref:Predicted protein n=1 Tax=Naegleria gruberi TaxID=5762 RepID=D2VY78_NAEGR|nr:uncharacterized protein NAEGRDRAFT_53198 [Naegleria gruberi]EFC38201.1 predicted protein [Naegleria gruberi]|eukprot:XP_002670945.1 predicted protein [Naegleria gruberi strain NEG-M]
MKKNQNANNMSFIDETSNVTKKAKVKKRNKELKIKQSRLRKPLQNDNLLKNYFEFDKQQLTESDLTIYKIINPPNASTDNTFSENITTCSNASSLSSGTSENVKDTIITKVKCKTMNNTNNLNQHASSNIEYSSSSLTINNSSGGSSSSGSSDNTSKEEEEEAVEFDDCESFLSSISFLYN